MVWGSSSPPGVFGPGRYGGAVAPYMLMHAMTVTIILMMPSRGWCAWALVGRGCWRRAVMAVGLWCGVCLGCLLAYRLLMGVRRLGDVRIASVMRYVNVGLSGLSVLGLVLLGGLCGSRC